MDQTVTEQSSPDRNDPTLSTSDTESHKSTVGDDDSLSKDSQLSTYPSENIAESHSPPPLEEICSRASSPDYSALIAEQTEMGTKSAANSPIHTSTVVDGASDSCSNSVQETSCQTSTIKDAAETSANYPSTVPEKQKDLIVNDQSHPENVKNKVGKENASQELGMEHENDDQPLDQLETVQHTPKPATAVQLDTVSQLENQPKPRKSFENGRIIAKVDVCINKPKVNKVVCQSRVQSVVRPDSSRVIQNTNAKSAMPTRSPTKLSRASTIVGPPVRVPIPNKSPSPQKQTPVSVPMSRPSTSPHPPVQAQVARKGLSPPVPTSPSPTKLSPQSSDSAKRKQFKAINMLGRNVISSCIVKSKVSKPVSPADEATSPTVQTDPQKIHDTPKKGVTSRVEDAPMPTVKAVTSIIRPSPVSVIHKNPSHQTSTAPPVRQSLVNMVRPAQHRPQPTTDLTVAAAPHHSRAVLHDEQPIRQVVTSVPQQIHPPARIQSNPSQVRPKVVHQKYPPPTPVEGLHGGQSKWPAIKTIKMANGETCGIKVQSPSVFTKVNIPNAKLREVKQQIAMQEAKKKRSRDYRINKPPPYSNSSYAAHNAAQARHGTKTITVPINPIPVEHLEQTSTPPLPPPLPQSVGQPVTPPATKTSSKPLSQNLLSRGRIIGTAKLKNNFIKSPKNSSSQMPGKPDANEKVGILHKKYHATKYNLM